MFCHLIFKGQYQYKEAKTFQNAHELFNGLVNGQVLLADVHHSAQGSQLVGVLEWMSDNQQLFLIVHKEVFTPSSKQLTMKNYIHAISS